MMSNRRFGRKGWVVAFALMAMFCLALLPSVVMADEGEYKAIQDEITAKGLGWTPKLYDRKFALGANLDKEERAPDKPPLADDGAALAALPTSIDWRNKGGNWVSPVKDQGSCGSCWAFSSVAALESKYAMRNNTPGSFLDLSEQILVSCSTGNMGCDGGYMDATAEFLQNTGTYYETCFPYTATNNNCNNACANWRTNAFKITEYEYVSRDVTAMKQALQNGPFQVSFYVYGDFDYYGGGVYEYAWGQNLGGHAVLLVGYVDTAGQYGGGYFIVKNSWGTSWGENGYFRIGYSQVSNNNVQFGKSSYQYSLQTVAADSYEPDNTYSQAKVITSGVQQTHSIRPVGDVDWVKFTLTKANSVTLQTSGLDGYDTRMWLYDSSQHQLAFDDDSGTGYYAAITANLNPGTYYAKIDEYNSNDIIGTYYIDLKLAQSAVTEVEYSQPTRWIANFGTSAGGWSSFDTNPRFLADVNGDGKADIVGCGAKGVYVSLSTGSGFGTPKIWISNYGANVGGWTSYNTYPRAVADVNNDGRADLVGFGSKGVYVSLSTGSGFGAGALWINNYGVKAGGWTSFDVYPRLMADVNSDGRADIVAFGAKGVYVSLSTGSSFGAATLWIANYGVKAGGWTSYNAFPRAAADVNNDGLADVIGFGSKGAYVSLSSGSSFGASSLWVSDYGASAGSWTEQNTLPRIVADANGDGYSDVFGFGATATYLSYSDGGSFAARSEAVDEFSQSQGWSEQDLYPRAGADVNGDGKGDIVGFAADGVMVSIAD